MDKERKKRLLHSLAATGAGTAAVPLTAAAIEPLRRLMRVDAYARPHVSDVKAGDFPLRAFGKDQVVRIEPGIPAQSSTVVEVPEFRMRPESTPKVSLPALAHESGHLHGGALQGLSHLVSKGFFFQPGRLPIVVSPVHAGLALAAAAPKKEKRGILQWIQSHPEAVAAGMSAVPLAGEAHASIRALRGIQKVYGAKAARASVAPLAKAFGTHAAAHVPAIAGLAVMSRVRDWLQKRREKSLEKKGEAAGGGFIGRAVDRPLGGTYNMPVQWTNFPWMNSEVNLMKPRKKQADPDRPEILQSATSTMLGVQE